MIVLNWARFPESDIKSFNVYRSIIGFMAPIVDLHGKTLLLKIDNGPTRTINFLTTDIINTINSITELNAYITHDGLNFIVRPKLQSALSIEIIGGSALSFLGLTPHLISEQSEDILVSHTVAPIDTSELISFIDYDGTIQDFYAITTVSSLGIESRKSTYRQAITTTGPLCVIEGLIIDGQGSRIVDAEIKATIQVPPAMQSSMIGVSTGTITTLSGPDGRFSLPLLQGILVRLEVPAIGFGRMITVPAKAYVFLNDLPTDGAYRLDDYRTTL